MSFPWVLLMIAALLSGICAIENLDPSPEPSVTRCVGNLTFEIHMKYTWEPGFSVAVEQEGPGFSSLLCIAHGPDYSLWSVGERNSDILNGVLQSQNYSLLEKELDGNKTWNRVAYRNISKAGVVDSPGSDVVNVVVQPSMNATLISCIAGIVPSPDWFIGISALEMCDIDETGSYSYPNATKSIKLRTYDAEFDDTDTAMGESQRVESPRPVRLRVGLGELGTADIVQEGPSVTPNETTLEEKLNQEPAECFPASAAVELDDGRQVHMRDLDVTHRILSARGAYSDVFMFSHCDPHVVAEFITLRFMDKSMNKSSTLTASRGHYVYIQTRSSPGLLDGGTSLATMDTVRRGDNLIDRDGRPLRVVQAVSTWEQGLYNPHTIDGDLVVNGVLVSSLTRAVAPTAAAMALRPLRIMYACGLRRVVHQFSKLLLSGRFNSVIAKLLPSGR